MVAALLGAVAHVLVLEAKSVLAIATSVATAEALRRAAEYGLKEGFWSAQVGSGARAAGKGTHGKRRSPGFGGALRLPFCRPRGCERRRASAQVPLGRVSRQVPRSVSWNAPLLPLEGAGGGSPFLPAQTR